MLWLLTGQGDVERINYGRKDVIMMILAMEAGLELPPVLFEVAETLKSGTFEMRERFAISSSEEEAGGQEVGFASPDDCIFWFGNGAYFSPTTARCMFIVGDAYQLWERHPIWQQLRPAWSLWQTDPFIVDTVADIVRDLGRYQLLYLICGVLRDTYPYVIKNQRKARNAPSRGLWVP